MPIDREPQCPLVDIRRDNSRYIRAADLIATAPDNLDHEPVRFSFRRVAEYAGRWTRMLGEPEELADACATLTTGEPGKLAWYFRTDASQSPLRLLPGISNAKVSDVALSGADEVRSPLLDPTLFWDQMILMVQHRWNPEFPAGSWWVASVDLNAWPVRKAPPGSWLSATLTKRRRRALETALFIDGHMIGTGLFAITIDEPRRS